MIDKKEQMSRAVKVRWRKAKKLCERCGMDPHDGECIETFTATDMRNLPIEVKAVDLKKKKDTVISYRKKKNLCELCGGEKHQFKCCPTYDVADNRTDEQKKERPAIVPTPKKTGTTILKEIIIKKDIELIIQPKRKITLHRKFIVLNLFKSSKDDIVEFSCVSQLSRRFKDYIVCMIGKIDKHFVYSDVMKINKITNIMEIRPCDEQTVVNYIGSCSKLFSFPTKLYTPICIKFDIPYYEFPIGKNATNFHPDTAYII